MWEHITAQTVAASCGAGLTFKLRQKEATYILCNSCKKKKTLTVKCEQRVKLEFH